MRTISPDGQQLRREMDDKGSEQIRQILTGWPSSTSAGVMISSCLRSKTKKLSGDSSHKTRATPRRRSLSVYKSFPFFLFSHIYPFVYALESSVSASGHPGLSVNRLHRACFSVGRPSAYWRSIGRRNREIDLASAHDSDSLNSDDECSKGTL